MVFSIRILIALVLCLIVSACHRKNGGQGNATGYEGRNPKELIALTMDNARVRCQFKEERNQTYLIDCRSVAITAAGVEVIANELSEGLSLEWEKPVKIQGAELSSLHCETIHSGLGQQCRAQLDQPVATEVQFSISLSERSSGKTKKESDLVLLPYSVSSFGVISQLKFFQTSSMELGYKPQSLDPLETYIGTPYSACKMGEKLFLAGQNMIYQLEGGKLAPYAGSSALANNSDLSHRLRMYLGNQSDTVGIFLACGTGKLYVSDSASGRVLEIQDEGPVKLLAHIPSSQRLAVAKDGSLFVVDRSNQSLIQINALGERRTVASTLGTQLRGVAVANDGTIFVSDQGQGVIRKIAPNNTVSVFASNLNYPDGLSIAKDGSVFVAELLNGRILKITQSGEVRVAWARQEARDGGRFLAPYQPTDIVLDNDTLLITDVRNRQILKLTASGELSIVAGARYWSQPDAVSMPVEKVKFQKLNGFVLNSDGSLLFADREHNRIQKLSSDGKLVSSFAGNGTSAIFNRPNNVTPGIDGSLYVSNFNDGVFSPVPGDIKRMDPQGTITTVVASVMPTSLAVGPNGTLYFWDLASQSLRSFSAGNLGTVAGTENSFGTAKHGARSIAVDSSNVIYVADTQNHLIRKIEPQGGITTIAGTGAAGFNGDGIIATAATLLEPTGIFIGRNGIIYFADSGNFRVRYLKPETGPTPGIRYRVGTFFGGTPQADCTGSLFESSTRSELEDKFYAGLSKICAGRPTAVAVQDSCDTNQGSLTYYFSQQFFVGNSVIVKAVRPCP